MDYPWQECVYALLKTATSLSYAMPATACGGCREATGGGRKERLYRAETAKTPASLGLDGGQCDGVDDVLHRRTA